MKRFRGLIAVFTAVAVLLSSGLALADFAPQWQALTAQLENGAPTAIYMTAKLHDWSPFDEETVAGLNRILEECGVSMFHQSENDREIDQWSIVIGGTPAMDFTAVEEHTGYSLATSLLPGKLLYSANLSPLSMMQEGAGDLALGQEEDQWLFQVPQWSAYLDGLTRVLAPYGKEKKASKKFAKIGTAKQSVVYTLTKEEAARALEEFLPSVDQRWLSDILVGITFTGKLTVTLYKDEQGVPLALAASGQMSSGMGTARTVTFQWSFKEAEGERKDILSLKAPQVKGKDKTTVSYSRTETAFEGQNSLTVSGTWNSTADSVSAKKVLAASLTNTLGGDNQRITGEVSVADTQDGKTVTRKIQPTILTVQYGEDICAKCSFRMTTLEDKRTTLDATLSITADPAQETRIQLPEQIVFVEELEPAALVGLREQFQTNLVYQTVRAVLTLPKEALDVLSKGLSEEEWQSILDAAS